MPKSYLLVRFWWISVAGYCRNNSGKCAGGPALTIQDGCLTTKALNTVPAICPEPAEQDFFCCCLIWSCDMRQPIREQYQFWSQLTPAWVAWQSAGPMLRATRLMQSGWGLKHTQMKINQFWTFFCHYKSFHDIFYHNEVAKAFLRYCLPL